MLRLQHDCRRRPWAWAFPLVVGLVLVYLHAHTFLALPPASSGAPQWRPHTGAAPAPPTQPSFGSSSTSPGGLEPTQPSRPDLPYCSDPKRHAFFFFTGQPGLDLLTFAAELAQKGPFDVHLIIDDNSYNWTTALAAKYPRVRTHFVDAAWVESVKMTHFGGGVNMQLGSVIALDKAVALAAYMEDDTLPAVTNRILTSDNDGEVFVNATTGRPTRLRYCRIWFVENDAFIPSVGAALHLDSLVTAAGADYAGPPVETYFANIALPKRMYWFHWKSIIDFLSETTSAAETAAAAAAAALGAALSARPNADQQQQAPVAPQASEPFIAQSSWCHAMTNAIAISDRYLLKMRALALDRGRLYFSEPFLPTMAVHWNLTVWDPSHGELVEVWRLAGTRDKVNWFWPAMRAQCKDPLMRCWFHPLKSERMRKSYRKRVRLLEAEVAANATRLARAAAAAAPLARPDTAAPAAHLPVAPDRAATSK